MLTVNDKYKSIIYYVGMLCRFVALVLILPLFSLFFYPTEWYQGLYFVISAVFAYSFSMLCISFGKNHKQKKLVSGQDAIIVVLSWIVAVIFSAMPFLISGQLHFSGSIFEAVSGWTTTGLSVVDVTKIPAMFLLHRSVIQFFGGVGLVLVVFAILSETYGMRLFSAEGHNDRLMPNISKSARIVMMIYSVYMVAGVVLYVAFGMPLFDAINISMSALSTGGFAVTTNSIAAYDSIPIEFITVLLMILGNTNFAGHLLLVNKKYKQIFKMDEVRFVIVALLFLTGLLTTIGYFTQTITLRQAFFEAASAITTTGFSITVYSHWRPVAVILLISFMVIGGGSGSTAGGIKQFRIVVMFKSLILNIKKRFLPKQVIKDVILNQAEGARALESHQTLDIYQFVFLYFLILMIGSLIISSFGYPFQDALFEFASAIGTVGTSVGITSIHAPLGVLWIEIIGMMLGRLEIIVYFVAFIAIGKDASDLFGKS
jgi:trk system potassium uptake protein